jgi:hypothetical protein
MLDERRRVLLEDLRLTVFRCIPVAAENFVLSISTYLGTRTGGRRVYQLCTAAPLLGIAAWDVRLRKKFSLASRRSVDITAMYRARKSLSRFHRAGLQ